MAAILFLMRYPLDGLDNLRNKFDGQMAAMEAMGHEAYCIGWSRSGMYLCRGQERTLLKKCPLTRMPGYSKTVLYIDLMDALKNAPADKLRLEFTSGVAPCVILPAEGEEKFIYMVLPVRLKAN